MPWRWGSVVLAVPRSRLVSAALVPGGKMVSSCHGFSFFRVPALVQAEEEKEWSSVALRQTQGMPWLGISQWDACCTWLAWWLSLEAALCRDHYWTPSSTKPAFGGGVKHRYPAGAFETPSLSSLAKAMQEALWNCRRCITDPRTGTHVRFFIG